MMPKFALQTAELIIQSEQSKINSMPGANLTIRAFRGAGNWSKNDKSQIINFFAKKLQINK